MRKTATSILNALGCEAAELSVILISDPAMRKLNRRWRKQDRTTDVLAFAQAGPAPGLLGDVVISLPTARRQARERGQALADELRILLVHGVLHLLGYDHEPGGAEARRMRQKEARLLKRIQEVEP
jgi:probable rRNA maturation factor